MACREVISGRVGTLQRGMERHCALGPGSVLAPTRIPRPHMRLENRRRGHRSRRN